jgi:hypothetical protein
MAEENKPNEEENINYTTNNLSTEESANVGSNNETTNINETPVEINEEFVKPKKSIFLKVLFGIVGLLVLLLIVGLILYFTGFFEPKEEEKKIEQPVMSKETVTKVEPVSENNYKFDLKDINSKKLNDQLANLTSKNVTEEKKINKESIENEKIQEDLLKQKALLEEEKAKLEKEKAQIEIIKKESTTVKEEVKITPNTPMAASEELSVLENKKEVDNPTLAKNSTSIQKENKKEDILKENVANNQFLLFINVAKIKDVLYKKYLDKIIAINPNVKLCRDEKNKIEIYFGPFEKNEDRTELLNKLIKHKFTEAYEVEFTKEEFDKRCNY